MQMRVIRIVNENDSHLRASMPLCPRAPKGQKKRPEWGVCKACPMPYLLAIANVARTITH